MNQLVIRKAVESDVATVAEMDKLCFSAPWSETSFREEITGNKVAMYIVAEIGGRVVGYAGIWLVVDEGHITNVAVHPDYRRLGIGKALVAVLLDICSKEDIVAQTLEVRPSNEAALALYRGYGFAENGRRRGYYEDNGEDAVIMWRGARTEE